MCFLYFNMEHLIKKYSNLNHFSKDSENLIMQTLPTLVESLMIPLSALQSVNSYMKKQPNIKLKSMDEIMKQTEISRRFIENRKSDSLSESSSINLTYAEALQVSLIVLKPISSQKFSKTKCKEKYRKLWIK